MAILTGGFMRVISSATATATVLAVVGLTAAPASALDANDVPGPNGKITFLEHETKGFKYTGQMESRERYDTNFKNDLFNDEASVVFNKSNRFWLLYDDTQYRDRAVCVRPQSWYLLRNAGFNDKMSSARRMTQKRSSSCGTRAVIGVKFD